MCDATDNTVLYAHNVIQACIQEGKLLAEEEKNHRLGLQHLDEGHHELMQKRAAYELTEGTPSYADRLQRIAYEQQRLATEKEKIHIEQQHLLQQKNYMDSAIAKIQQRMADITHDNPDIIACITDIQEALALSDRTKIDLLQKIITKYLGDKQVGVL